jgi:aspartate/methionine/tyrosine aminotransferase
MGLFHISDEAYEHFLFEGSFHCSPASFDGASEHTISIFSFSKSFGMSGFRLGYMVIPRDVLTHVLKVQDTVSICPPVPSQAAGEAALRLYPQYTREFLPKIDVVRKIFIKRLSSLDCLEMPLTKGAFYFFIRLKTSGSSGEIAKRLIEEHGVIAIPGEAFGADYPSLRLSYGNLTENEAEKGLDRLINGLDKILGIH